MIEYQVCNPDFEPLWSMKHPETGERLEHIVLPGTRASGKTVSAALAVIHHCRNPKLIAAGRGLRVVVTRQFGSTIDTSYWEELGNAARIMGVYDEFDWGRKRIVHKYTGSTITSMGLERNKGNIKGLAQVDLLIVEEAKYVSQESIDILIPTVRKPFSCIIWIYNPENANDPVAQTFVERETPYPASIVINSHWSKNKFFSSKSNNDRLAMLSSDPVRYRNVWEGEYVGEAPNTVISPVMIQEARKAKTVATPDIGITAGIDVAFLGKDEAVIVRRQGMRVISTHTKAKGTETEILDWVKSVYVEHGWDLAIIDATGSRGVADHVNQWAEANRSFETIAWIASWSPQDKQRYSNARTEIWFRTASWLREGGYLPTSRGDKWDQLSTCTYRYLDKDKRALDAKSKLAKSPDWGDALAMTLWAPDPESKAAKVKAKTWARGDSRRVRDVEY